MSLWVPIKSALCLHLETQSTHWYVPVSPLPEISSCYTIAPFLVFLFMTLWERCFALTVGPWPSASFLSLVFPTSLDSAIQPHSQQCLNKSGWSLLAHRGMQIFLNCQTLINLVICSKVGGTVFVKRSFLSALFSLTCSRKTCLWVS